MSASSRPNRAQRRAGAKPLGQLTSKVLAPVIARRAGMTQDLLGAWEELCGSPHAAISRPERISWPRRAHDDDPFEPGTLIVACDGAGAVLLQHEADEVVARINRFFGFRAIARMRLVQRPVAKVSPRERNRLDQGPVALDEPRRMKLEGIIAQVDDADLKARLEKLGERVFARSAASRKNG